MTRANQLLVLVVVVGLASAAAIVVARGGGGGETEAATAATPVAFAEAPARAKPAAIVVPRAVKPSALPRRKMRKATRTAPPSAPETSVPSPSPQASNPAPVAQTPVRSAPAPAPVRSAPQKKSPSPSLGPTLVAPPE